MRTTSRQQLCASLAAAVCAVLAAASWASPPTMAAAVSVSSSSSRGVPTSTADPATASVLPLQPNDMNRYGRQPGDQFRRQDSSGNNPVDDNYRRGVFGRRRRRVPYGESDPQLQSVNPFHQFNNARNLPMDVFKPRGATEVNDLAYQKRLADFAAQSNAFSLPYGGYSSFRNHVFRRATADPLFRMKLHRSVNGHDDPHNPMGVNWDPAAAGVRQQAAMTANGLRRQVVNGAPFPVHWVHPHAEPNFHSDGTPYRWGGSVLDGTNPYLYPGYNYGFGYHPAVSTEAFGPTTAVNPYEASMAGVSPYALPTATAHPYWAGAAGLGAMAPNQELHFLNLAAMRGAAGAAGAHAYAYDPLHWHHTPAHGGHYHRLGNANARNNDGYGVGGGKGSDGPQDDNSATAADMRKAEVESEAALKAANGDGGEK